METMIYVFGLLALAPFAFLGAICFLGCHFRVYCAHYRCRESSGFARLAVSII